MNPHPCQFSNEYQKPPYISIMDSLIYTNIFKYFPDFKMREWLPPKVFKTSSNDEFKKINFKCKIK